MSGCRELCLSVVDNISRVIVGKKRAVEHTLLALLCEGHLLIEDVPGVGKTTLAAALAKSVDCSFARIQFTPDILPSDITGFSLFNPKSGDFEYRQGLVMSSFILADEINRTSPKTQASLLEVMEENQVTVDGVTRQVGKPFMVIATQNPSEYVGTYPLPEAQMDRFLMRLSVGYPERDDEMAILRRFRVNDPFEQLTPVVKAEDVTRLQEAVREIHVEESLYAYIVDIVRGTRAHPDVELGASPRGALALFRASQALALYLGREFALPDDVKYMARYVLPHRLLLRQEARLRRVSREQVVDGVIGGLPVPIITVG
ncbi:MAG: MoxR family ATPase [Oscillospiraceae bacterium]|jgi:MoxR-like ATPase|nr:MoxR family ATPase [Oscillospiraceae bacterium]